MIHDAAVIMPTIARPSLLRAVRSIYAQDFRGTVQIMLGVDKPVGPMDLVDELRAECPANWAFTVMDLGYSTSHRHGGVYHNNAGGALRTALSYMANSHYLAYLDDDNWWAPDHLRSLRQAIGDGDWAFSLRWLVDPKTMEPFVVDRWESVGPGKGSFQEQMGGFVDTNCLMLNKAKCHWDLPAWCVADLPDGQGEDRTLFKQLRNKRDIRATGEATVYYVLRPDVAEVALETLRKYREPQGGEADVRTISAPVRSC